jgi:predicted pyridoxine 5'-phosphate oxidase superfamily flavin-nucleotide-binding protein
MTTQQDIIKAAAKAFNTIKILKGQSVSIATSDNEGTPNVAPIGSMRFVDDSRVHVLQGFLARTGSNLKKNPKATFLVCLRPRLLENINLFRREPNEGVLGYQVTCEYQGSDDSSESVAKESRFLLKRIPWFLRSAFRKFCEKNLKRLLKFKVLEVRAIN